MRTMIIKAPTIQKLVKLIKLNDSKIRKQNHTIVTIIPTEHVIETAKGIQISYSAKLNIKSI